MISSGRQCIYQTRARKCQSKGGQGKGIKRKQMLGIGDAQVLSRGGTACSIIGKRPRHSYTTHPTHPQHCLDRGSGSDRVDNPDVSDNLNAVYCRLDWRQSAPSKGIPNSVSNEKQIQDK